jgi:cobalamin biosynthesis Mg chelatase CobN
MADKRSSEEVDVKAKRARHDAEETDESNPQFKEYTETSGEVASGEASAATHDHDGAAAAEQADAPTGDSASATSDGKAAENHNGSALDASAAASQASAPVESCTMFALLFFFFFLSFVF